MTDIAMVRGDTPSFELDINNKDGSAYDLTGYTVHMTAKRHPDDPGYRALFSKHSGGTSPTITVTNAAGGLARVDMAVADTHGIDVPVELFFDIEVEDGTHFATPITGKLTIGADATP